MSSVDEKWQLIYKTAGFLAAHAVWHLYDHQIVIPNLTWVAGEKKIVREIIVDTMDQLSAAIARANSDLLENTMGADFAMLLYPASIELENKARTCIIIDLCDYGSNPTSSRLVVPFTQTNKFFRKKLVMHPPGQMDRSADFDVPLAMQAFFDGVNEHEQGAAIWNKNLDQSQ